MDNHRKTGSTELQIWCSVFLSTVPFHFTPSPLYAQPHVRSCGSVSKFRGEMSVPNLESRAMAWLVGPLCLWSQVYEIWGLSTVLSQQVKKQWQKPVLEGTWHSQIHEWWYWESWKPSHFKWLCIRDIPGTRTGKEIQQWRTGRCVTHGDLETCQMTTKGDL